MSIKLTRKDEKNGITLDKASVIYNKSTIHLNGTRRDKLILLINGIWDNNGLYGILLFQGLTVSLDEQDIKTISHKITSSITDNGTNPALEFGQIIVDFEIDTDEN